MILTSKNQSLASPDKLECLASHLLSIGISWGVRDWEQHKWWDPVLRLAVSDPAIAGISMLIASRVFRAGLSNVDTLSC